ncbi:hypothetical protein H257_09972 [Aphanomyces astaci]|uniref:Cytosol aminopeptidase domain-containing protein n=2 Tax=Aphanomyces astaci TaxID=112090 RepID=W4GAD5_APHAT|nr:hypothetical protein H257_09972 [Aphanomyces astaci]ETV76029.1 hypothetical protein H257_09972 [Aphanomyces astaci]RQM23070.1 hypothetical protein B5M09_005045 [Aphanomyces astaci]|eukprot:XP_009834671.1 hypothetical protein H257_09972 [Aphanomyces astaci]
MVRYVGSVADVPVTTAAKVLVIGTKETNGLTLAQRILTHLNHGTTPPSSTISLLTHAIASLIAGTDNAASTHVYLPLSDSVLVSVVVAQLPTAVSRHNVLARPHAISSLVRSHANDSSTSFVVGLSLPDPATTSWTGGVAVAKGISTYYNSKSTTKSGPSGVITDGAATAVTEDQVVVVFDHAVDTSTLSLLNATATGIHLTQRLVDSPPNQLNTDTFVAEAKAVAARVHAEITVIQGEDLNTQGFGGIYGVGKAAANPPALVVLSHYPSSSSKSDKSVALVGKGIVYDTGGLSLKTSAFMVGMKFDMGGAAGLLGAFEAAVLAGTSSRPLHVVLCLAENAVGPLATRPDDIHTLYSGKTVEINNTDAEGRLVLGDGVAYAAKHLNPHVILDMATLTGAQGIATGAKHAAVVSNSAKLEAWVVASGRASGDFVHAMPYVPEFFRQEFKSNVADMKNIPATRMNAQVSCAGQFIANHLGLEFEQTGLWGHVDMAFPVVDQERGTGFGVALVQSLLQLIE